MKAAIQHYPGGRDEELGAVSAAQLSDVLRELEGETGSTLEVRPDAGDRPRLIVAVDKGRFTATAVLGDEFYDRVGDAQAEGESDLVIGGQTVEGVPARFVLNRQQTEEVLKDFITAEAWDLSDQWVRQKPGAWR